MSQSADQEKSSRSESISSHVKNKLVVKYQNVGGNCLPIRKSFPWEHMNFMFVSQLDDQTNIEVIFVAAIEHSYREICSGKLHRGLSRNAWPGMLQWRKVDLKLRFKIAQGKVGNKNGGRLPNVSMRAAFTVIHYDSSQCLHLRGLSRVD